MGKKQVVKPITPMSINETLYIHKLAKLYGLKAESMASYQGATFTAIKIKGDKISKKDVTPIIEAFKEQYDKVLCYEVDNLISIGYLTLQQ